MARTSTPRSSKEELAAFALQAARIGDLETARKAFLVALDADRSNPALHYNVGLVHEQMGAIADAASAFTRALHFEPTMEIAARRLQRLLLQFRLEDPRLLDAKGLKAALATPGIARQPIIEAALARCFVAHDDLAQALAEARAGKAAEAARRLLTGRTASGLGDDLLLAALALGIVTDAGQEALLSALRAALLLECPPRRFGDKALTAFAVALLRQCWNNVHVWAEGPDETAMLSGLALDHAALFSGDLDMSRRLLLMALYRPLASLLPEPVQVLQIRGIRPRPVREAVLAAVEVANEEQAIAAALPRLAAVEDETSERVGEQYARDPYPRWLTLQVSAPGSLRRALERYVPAPRLAFMDAPFDVLVAGAGTGQHALQAHFGYGPNVRMLATDLSAPSLAYAARKARQYEANGLEFLVADILALDGLDRRFDIIECVGVLHHMADPWAGWEALTRRLKPHGLMFIGLYSATSRARLAELRSKPAWPGADCSDEQARAWRQALLAGGEDGSGRDLPRSKDFYTLPGFRDLALNTQEHHVTLPLIEAWLASHDLAFRGFTVPPGVISAFAVQNPSAPWPGSLSAWSRFEAENPSTFDGMYLLWCERGG